MHEIARYADQFGPAKILHVDEPRTGLIATLVVDNFAAGLPHGGGKMVVVADPKMVPSKKEVIIRALAASLRDIDEYILAPDMGTNGSVLSEAVP